MFMRKVWSLGLVAFAVVTLTGCTSSSSLVKEEYLNSTNGSTTTSSVPPVFQVVTSTVFQQSLISLEVSQIKPEVQVPVEFLVKKDGQVLRQFSAGDFSPLATSIAFFKQTPDYLALSAPVVGVGSSSTPVGVDAVWLYRPATNEWTKLQEATVRLTDISPNGRWFAGVRQEFSQQPAIFVKSVAGKEAAKMFQYDGFYNQVLNVVFSPDSKKIAYVVEVKTPAGLEQSAVFTSDVETAAQTFVAKTTRRQNGRFIINGWKDNETVDYSFVANTESVSEIK